MQLYALKSEQGYLKADKKDGYQLVNLNKASVFSSQHSKKLIELQEKAKHDKLANLRLVELEIREKEL
ncbi:hypothetical protein [Halanaerobium hydrogeniformans]|uniref:Uncharacterized protein n=1 Tax=Halanaerobium hydrogeniformans TaxID=656519 RepID=E4RNS0_HALHG|nr:hypothetical protein [Halanaerobium hydrogeniformans]ADQ13748.1 hypothetical protein Halsa_0269 [Halanaerobium hydrogeniformans]